MPTYEYACRDCGRHVEVVQSFRDDALTTCGTCAGRLRKVYAAAGIIFKGSGYYVNDSRTPAAGEGSSPTSGGKDGGAKEGVPKEGAAKDGGGKDGRSKDGGSKDGGSKDGRSKDGRSKDGRSQHGGSQHGGSKDGGARERAGKDGGARKDAPASPSGSGESAA